MKMLEMYPEDFPKPETLYFYDLKAILFSLKELKINVGGHFNEDRGIF
jgi:hypothetical protein